MATPSKPSDLLASLPPAQRDALMAEATREAQRRKRQQSAVDYSHDPVRFVREVLHVKDIAPYQAKILETLVTDRRVCTRSPHGAGKSALAAWALLWALFSLGDDTKIVTTASVHRQTKFLWREIKKWAGRASFDPRPTILDMSLRFAERNIEAFAVASDDPYSVEGIHGDHVFLIFDEAKAISEDYFDALEGALSAGDTYALMLSTPGQPSGRFFDIHARRAGLTDWTPIHVTLSECISAGRISAKWADDRKKQWGENSPVYKMRVCGEFCDSEDNLIPLSWIEAANERWQARNGKGEGNPTYGVDPARYGEDQTAICRLVGSVCEKITYHAQQSTMQTAGRVAALVDKTTPVGVDVVGLGSGVFDRLEEQGYNVIPVNVAEAATDERGKPLTDKSGQLHFINKRSALWWMLREALDVDNPDALALPPDDKLTGDLSAPMWDYTSSGKIRVESKDDLRARLGGRSTDSADSLALAVYAGRPKPVSSFTVGKYFGLFEKRSYKRYLPD